MLAAKHESRHASLLFAPADVKAPSSGEHGDVPDGSSRSTSPLRNVDESRSATPSSSNPRRGPPAPLDLADVNKPFSAKAKTVVDHSTVPVAKSDRNKYIELESSSDTKCDSKCSEDQSERAPTMLKALMPSKTRQAEQPSEPSSFKSILRDAGRRIQGSSAPNSNAVHFNPSQETTRPAQPKSVLPATRLDHYNDFGQPPEETKGLTSASPGWLDAQEIKLGVPGAEAPPPPKPRFSRKAKRIAWVVGAVLLAIIIAVPVAVSLTQKKSDDNVSNIPLPQDTVVDAAGLEECLSLYRNAEADVPSSYPCNVCQPLLREAGNDFRDDVKDAPLGTGAALQFCSLIDIYQTSEATRLRLFTEGNWGKGVNPCHGWKGVRCENNRVTHLSLEEQIVPASIPESIGDLAALRRLRIVGTDVKDGGETVRHPRGAFPREMSNLNLTTLDIEYTAFTELVNIDFRMMPHIEGLILMANNGLKGELPNVAYSHSMRTLTINGLGYDSVAWNETLLDTIIPTSLTSLDLSNNGLAGDCPAFEYFSQLDTLNLKDNNFTSITFQRPFTTILLAGNEHLEGVVPMVWCDGGNVRQCDLRETQLTFPDSLESCGVCKLSKITKRDEWLFRIIDGVL